MKLSYNYTLALTREDVARLVGGEVKLPEGFKIDTGSVECACNYNKSGAWRVTFTASEPARKVTAKAAKAKKKVTRWKVAR